MASGAIKAACTCDAGTSTPLNVASFAPQASSTTVTTKPKSDAALVVASIILKLQHWLEGHADSEITVAGMADRTKLSGRTFLRRFKKATSYTPNSYLQNLRIEKARGLLERTRIPVSEIGWNVGYQDASAFSRVFRATTGLTAGEYRNRFGLLARSGM
ncbi:MAG: helix-turn-helix domain-containing protein [Rhizobiaceae bacterium]|nr:helix-turn-helix domain-containing protein [Rhizobiaceae bacterium]